MSNKDEYDDEDDEDGEQDPFDFFKYFGESNKFFQDPNKFFIDPKKLFSSKQFRQLFNDLLKKVFKISPEFQNLSPEDLMKEFTKNKSKFGLPIISGFKINIGPDGKPTFDSFGNIIPEPLSGDPVVKSKREPLIEVSEEKDQIIVIAEMPGVDRDDIELEATSDSLIISTKENAKRHYHKNVKLHSAINSDVAKARYTNGILEVRLKKIDEKRTNIQID